MPSLSHLDSMPWIDTHAHLDLPRFGDADTQREAMRRAQAADVAAVVIPGVAPAGWDGLLATAARLRVEVPGVCFHTALGIHPQVLPDLEVTADGEICAALGARVLAPPTGMVAIGECGLDFAARVVAGAPRARQVAVLRTHMALARRTGLPLLLHCVGAHGALLELLTREPIPPSILHSWSGSAEMARHFITAGHYLSFAGSITLPRARRMSTRVCRSPPPISWPRRCCVSWRAALARSARCRCCPGRARRRRLPASCARPDCAPTRRPTQPRCYD